MAAQDQSFFTENHQAKVINYGADPRYRFCEKFEENVDHLVS